MGRTVGAGQLHMPRRLAPAWRDINPAKIKTELPIVWFYRCDATQDEFVGGLAGDAIHRLLGGAIKNARFHQLHKAAPHFLSSKACFV